MIAQEFSNSTNRTAVNLAAQRAATPLTTAERQAWNRDFRDGYRRFWKGEPLGYCCNGGERAGYYAAGDEEAAEYRRECEHADFVRSLGR